MMFREGHLGIPRRSALSALAGRKRGKLSGGGPDSILDVVSRETKKKNRNLGYFSRLSLQNKHASPYGGGEG